MKRESLPDQLDLGVRSCVELCLECHGICLSTLSHCLKKGGSHAEASHIQALTDCAESCRMNADFLLRSSPLQAKCAALCAEACVLCAESCLSHEADEQMKACAKVAQQCASKCHEMAAGESRERASGRASGEERDVPPPQAEKPLPLLWA